MRLPGFEGSFFGVVRDRSVEVGVSKKRLGGIGARLEKSGFVPGKLKIALADVGESSATAEVASRFVGGRNFKASARAVAGEGRSVEAPE